MKTQGFPKHERIVSKKLIDELFNSGQSHSLTAFPLRAVFLTREHALPIAANEEPVPPRVTLLISVSKRHFKHAVDRNRVKRQLREAFRHHKQQLTDSLPETTTLAIAFVWMADRHRTTEKVEECVVSLFKRIAQTITHQQP